jgi:hypothetical protein
MVHEAVKKGVLIDASNGPNSQLISLVGFYGAKTKKGHKSKRMIWTVAYEPEGQSETSKTSLNDLASAPTGRLWEPPLLG